MTMLDRMRRHKSWLKWSLGLVVLTFILFYIPDFLQDSTSAGTSTAEVIADVDGHNVTAGQFRRRYQTQMQAYQGAYGATMNEQLLKQLGIDRQVLQQMVDEQASLAEAERQGITVSDEELAQQIFAIPAFQENGKFAGEQRYEQVLRSQRPPVMKSDFEDNMRHNMMIDRLRAALTDWLSVPDADIERAYRQRNEKVKLQVVSVPASTFRDKVTVTDADVAARHAAHKDEYRIGERRKIRFLLLDVDQVRAKTVIPAADVAKFYNDSIQQYSTAEQIRASHILLKTDGQNDAAVRTQADGLLAQVKAGADFAELAKKYSEDDGTKALGGDLDYFSHGRMVPEFESVAFAMEPGKPSEIVKTQYGFHIIKLVDKKPATVRSLEDVRTEITEQLKFQKSQEAVADQSRALGAKIKKPEDIDRVAKESGLTAADSGFFASGEPVPGIGGAPQVAQEAFKMKDGEVSGALTSPRGPVFITVTGKKEPYVPALDEVKDKVREDAITERATALSRERATTVATALRAAKDFAAAAKTAGLEAKDTSLIAREAPIPDIGVNAEVDQVAFSLPVNGVSNPITTTNGTAIIRVAEREEVTPEGFAAAKDAFRRELENEKRGQFFSAYMTKAKEKMKISVNDDALKRVVGNQ